MYADLWQANVDAWRIYRTLCGRTVGECELRGYVIERLTETWAAEDILDLMARIDLIFSVVDPTHAAVSDRHQSDGPRRG